MASRCPCHQRTHPSNMSDPFAMLLRRNPARSRLLKAYIASLSLFALLGLSAPTVQASETFSPDADGYIRNWVMLAPIPLPPGRPAGDLTVEEQVKNEAALQPKAGDKVTVNGKELTWQNITAEAKFFDFNAILKSINDHAAGYMVTYIDCDRDRNDVTMALGSNDEARLYLNGKDIYAVQDARTLELDADKGKVHLKKG